MNRLFRRGPARAHPSRWRPRLEALEDRTLLATRLVVPLTQPIDSLNSFHDLASAVAASTTVNGDVIQVEPGSTPGAATVSKTLTVRGDPGNGPPNLPATGALTLTANGVVLSNLNAGPVTIANGVTGVQVLNSTVAGITQTVGPQVNGGDLISGNTITGPVSLGSDSVDPAALSDQVLNNVFTGTAAGILLHVSHENVPIIRGNTFTDLANGTTAIDLENALGATVGNDTITLAGPASVGIALTNPNFAASATITDNRIDTALQGVGVALTKSLNRALLVNLGNNDLVRNLVGLRVTGDGSANADALGTIDAGLGVFGSQGGNDFHGYTGVGGHFAIVTANAAATPASVTARGNIFTAGNPGTVVLAGAGTVDVSAPLSPAAAFADRLFDDFLHRSGNPGPSGELSFWADMTAMLGTRRAARAFLRQPEALRNLVDLVYLKVLGRPADPVGEAFWVRRLQRGTTLEQLLSSFLGSAEFRLRANRLVPTSADPDSNYIASLYIVLLGRVPGSSEVAVWLARLPRLGRTGLALRFTSFPDFRQKFLTALYAGNPGLPATAFVTGLPDLLHRAAPPSTAEIARQISSRRDLLSLMADLAGSAEFASNG